MDPRTGASKIFDVWKVADYNNLPPGFSVLTTTKGNLKGCADITAKDEYRLSFAFYAPDPRTRSGRRKFYLNASRIPFLEEIAEHNPREFRMPHKESDHLNHVFYCLNWNYLTFSTASENGGRKGCPGPQGGCCLHGMFGTECLRPGPSAFGGSAIYHFDDFLMEHPEYDYSKWK